MSKLSDEEKKLCQAALAHAILRSRRGVSYSPATCDSDVSEALATWRLNWRQSLPQNNKADLPRVLRASYFLFYEVYAGELEALACLPLKESPALRRRFLLVRLAFIFEDSH